MRSRQRSEPPQRACSDIRCRLDRHCFQREPVDPVPKEGFEPPHHPLAEAGAIVDVFGSDVAPLACAIAGIVHGRTRSSRVANAASSSNFASTGARMTFVFISAGRRTWSLSVVISRASRSEESFIR